jgi:hypothetical protein
MTDRRRGDQEELDARAERVLRAWHRDLADQAPPAPMLAGDVDRIPDQIRITTPLLGIGSRRLQLVLVVALLLTTLVALAIGASLGRPYRPVISDDHWEILTLGDAFADKESWPALLAAQASADLGVDVSAGSFTCLGDCGSSGGPLDRIRGNSIIQEGIRDAEMIVVQPQPGWVVLPTLRAYFRGECGGQDNADCLRRAVDDYRAYTGELLDELYALSGPNTIIRVVASDAQIVRHWNPSAALGLGAIDDAYELQADDPESFTVVVAWFGELMKAALEASADRCIPVWDANAYFSGSDYRDLPSPQYFDGFELTAAGESIVADEVMALGYRPRLQGCQPAV